MKRTWILLVLTTMLALAVAALSGAAAPSAGEREAREAREIQIGFAIAPVPLNLQHKNLGLVGLGSYIVNAQASCADCHSCPTYAPGHNPFMGQPKQLNPVNYLAGGVPFGPIISSNITPDKSGRPAGLSFKQYLHVLRTGRDPVAGDLFQVMPWPAYQSMTLHDIEATYEYLRAIPSAQPGTCSGSGQ
jgi:hypothetical protein